MVLGSIFRAGLPLHEGMLSYFDDADNVALLSRPFLLQGMDGDVHGGEIVPLVRFNAQPAHFLYVALHASGGVVGEEEIVPPAAPQGLDNKSE